MTSCWAESLFPDPQREASGASTGYWKIKHQEKIESLCEKFLFTHTLMQVNEGNVVNSSMNNEDDRLWTLEGRDEWLLQDATWELSRSEVVALPKTGGGMLAGGVALGLPGELQELWNNGRGGFLEDGGKEHIWMLTVLAAVLKRCDNRVNECKTWYDLRHHDDC